MRNILLATITTLLLFNSCRKEDDLLPNNSVDIVTDSLIADFSYEIIVKENEPNIYQFKNLSKNATTYKWYFSDSDSSSLFEPSIQFPRLDTFYVRLVVSNGTKTSTKFRGVIVKNIIALDSNKNPIYGTKPKADFKLYINIDSTGFVNVLNTSSSNSTKVKWYVNGMFVSDQFSTALPVPNIYSVNIKLVTECKYGLKDSITKTLILHDNQIDFNSSHFLLKSTNPVTYAFYHSNYFNRYGITGLCFGNIFKDNLYEFVQGFEKTYDDLNEHDVILYLAFPDRIVYKRMKTFNISEYIPLLNALPGQYLFEERYSTEQINANTVRADFNDTVLYLKQTNTTKFDIIDTTLKHDFVGYLSSYTNATTLDIRLPSINYPQIGEYFHSFMKFPRNSTIIQSEKYSSSGSKTGGSYTLKYNGRKL